MQIPSPRVPPPLADLTRRRRTATGLAGGAYASGGSGNPRVLLDLGDGARGRVKERVLDLGPAAQVGDREQLRRRRELTGELLGDRRHYRPVALLRPDRLTRGRPLVVEERLRLSRVLALRGDGDRRLDQQRLLWDEVLDRVAGLLGGDRV